MSFQTKISPAFEPFLADSGEDDKRDAIVIFQAPPIEGLLLRGRLRELKRRLDEVKEQVAIQKAVEQKALTDYQAASRDLGYAETPLQTAAIGTGTLPVATVEVTRKTLAALAEQPDVLAVLPNQQIHLIQPRRVEYSNLIKKVRAIVLLQIENPEPKREQRLSRAERQAAILAVRRSAEASLDNINETIDRFDGKLLADRPDALGSIPIEITVAGINALARSDAVKAIIEDQPIYPEHLGLRGS